VLQINDNGWLAGSEWVESPNSDERPKGVEINLLVIHGISLPPGEFGGHWIDALFTNCLDCNAHPYFEQLNGLHVSAHLLIRRSGEIVQFVPFQKRAWHAGKSHFAGRDGCNDFSIGIELEGCDDVPYEAIQYSQLEEVTVALMNEYKGITLDRVVGHCDIAPKRKTDPGPAFDWSRFRQALKICMGKVG